MKVNELISTCRKSILNLMHIHDVHASQLAKEVNVPQPTLHRLLKGKTDDIKLSALLGIAEFFSVTIEQLIRNEISSSAAKDQAETGCRHVPIITWKEAIHFTHLSILEQREHITVSDKFSNATFSLKAKAAFEPKFSKDSLLIIDPKIEPCDGDIIVVSYLGSPEATIRLLVLDGPMTGLKQISQSQEGLVESITDKIIIIGVVLQTIVIHKHLK